MELRQFYSAFIEKEDTVAGFSDGSRALWEMARYPIYTRMLSDLGLYTSGGASVKSVGRALLKSGLRAFGPTLNSAVRMRKLQNRPLFFDSTRLVTGGRGRQEDLFVKPYLEKAEEPVFCRSDAWNLRDRMSPDNLDITYLKIKSRIGSKFFSKTHEKEPLYEFVREFSSEFGLRKQYAYLIDQYAWIRSYWLELFGRLLDRQQPPYVVLVCGYGKEPMIEACQMRGIPVGEIQHGVISRYHMGYSTPGKFKKALIPDLFFTFGEYWNRIHGLQFDAKKIRTVGYPHLATSMNRYRELEKKSQITFLSQPVIGERLSRIAVRLSEKMGNRFPLIYKLHPREIPLWRDLYPWLESADITVIGKGKPLHELLSESEFVTGVFSTAIYEALSFNCRVTLFNLPGIEYMDDLIKFNYVKLAQSEEEFDPDWVPAEVDSNQFFSNVDEKSIPEALKVLSQIRLGRNT